jgi:hypothetical protein
MREPDGPAVIDSYHFGPSVEQLQRDSEENAVLPKLLGSVAPKHHEVQGVLQIRVRENVRDFVEFAVAIGPDLQRRFSTPPNSYWTARRIPPMTARFAAQWINTAKGILHCGRRVGGTSCGGERGDRLRGYAAYPARDARLGGKGSVYAAYPADRSRPRD